MTKRKKFSPEQKVSILRQHLLEQVPISDLCDRHGITPNMFYRWQREFFERGTAAFERRTDSSQSKLEAKVSALQSKLASKDEVIAEIMASHVQLKKSLGEI